MGAGDRKTRRGKIWRKSPGKSRPKKKDQAKTEKKIALGQRSWLSAVATTAVAQTTGMICI